MSCHDYAEWIKYLAILATSPNASSKEHCWREALMLHKFILTLNHGNERVHLNQLKFTRIQGTVTALEQYHLVCQGTTGEPNQRGAMAGAVTIAPSPYDYS